MRIFRFFFMLVVSTGILFSQWTQVNTGLTNTTITSMFVWVDTVIVGTDGGGIFQSRDNGDSWTDVSGNIGNKHINCVRGAGTGTVVFAATDAGVFYTEDQINYVNNTNNLANTDAAFYWLGDADQEDADWLVGTNGGGLFTGPEKQGPWTAVNTGITGEGLIFNDIGGYSEGETEYMVMATEGGIFFSSGGVISWTAKNTGLSGDALRIQKLAGIGKLVFIATRNGLYNTMDMGDTWTLRIPNEKLNAVFWLQPTPTTVAVYAFGENGFYSSNWFDYTPVDMGGVTGGEVTCAVKNSTYIFIGTQSGGIFRRTIDPPASKPVTAIFSATPTSGDLPLTVQFTDLSTTTSAGAEPGDSPLNKGTPSRVSAITQWFWDFDNDGTVDDNTQNPSYTYPNAGTYSVELKVSDGVNADSTLKMDYITVNDPGAPQLTSGFTANLTSGTAPLSIQFTDASVATNTSITSWAWDFDNDGTVDATTQNPVHNYPNAGTYTVKLRISDGAIADSTVQTDYITVNAPLAQLTAAFTANPSTGIAPLSVQFTDASVATNTSITSRSWDFENDGTVDATTPNPTHNYPNAGTYTVKLRISDGTIADSATQSIIVTPVAGQITAGFSANPTGGFAPLTVQFTDTSAAVNTIITSWAWDFENDGVVDTTTQNPSHTYHNAGTYTVKLRVGDGTVSDPVTKKNYIHVAKFEYPQTVPVTHNYTYSQKTEIKNFKSVDYLIFGVPGNPDSLLGDFIGGKHKTDWQAYYDNGADANYLKVYDGSAQFKLTTGKAFWLLHNGPLSINKNVTQSTLSASKKATIHLHAGWNMITNPFASSVSWQDVITENSIVNPIFKYTSGFTVSTKLEPYLGYYYLNENPNLSELRIPYYSAVAKTGGMQGFDALDFALCIGMSSETGSKSDVVLGLNEGATAGRDAFDFIKPRGFGDAQDIFFDQPEPGGGVIPFYSDIRPAGNVYEAWKFQVVHAEGCSVRLHFNLLSDKLGLASDAFTLVNWSTGESISVKDGENYRLQCKYDRVNLSVFIGNQEEIDRSITTALPERFELSPNFPNPFNHETKIRFSNPVQTVIQVNLYNAQGQRIRTLYSGSMDAGHHIFNWDGLNDRSLELSSGLYILSVMTDSDRRFTQKIMLLK